MSFGTYDAQSSLPSDNNAARIPFLQAQNRIYFGLFDEAFETLGKPVDEETAHRTLGQLFDALRERKLNSTAEEWNAFVELCRRHPLMSVLHQDPFTHRAYSKPRGYAGDAEMMDFIYGREDRRDPPHAEPAGRHVFNFTTLAPASEGVRARRAFMAHHIDRIAETKKPNILSIAAGHLREAGLSSAVRRRRFGKFVALDADPLSSAEVARSYGHLGIETVTASFRHLLTNRSGLNEFDLVYSTGLFDYLDARIGRRLVTSMFQMLRPGGSLVVANFLPGIRDIGYMEAFMDWRLVYRNRLDMIDLTGEIPEEQVKSVNLASEDCKNIIFLEVTKL
jgi:extracellular factor (EF) 3-hydroxypalmitic acid methyl ester biosynthesis protein